MFGPDDGRMDQWTWQVDGERDVELVVVGGVGVVVVVGVVAPAVDRRFAKEEKRGEKSEEKKKK